MNVRHALRSLSHSGPFALWVIGSLAVGMAVAIAALALVNALLFSPFAGVTAQERLVRVAVSRTCGPDCVGRFASAEDYAILREGLTGLQGLAAYAQGDIAVAIPEARSLRGAVASPNFFGVLGVRPALGRLLSPDDERDQADVAVVAHHLWTSEFHGDPSVLGRSIRVADRFVQIVGVAPAFFAGIDHRFRDRGRGPDLWLPMRLTDAVLPLPSGGQRIFSFVGRLRDSASVSHIAAEAEVVAQRVAALRGEGARSEVVRVWRTRPENRRFTVALLMPIPVLVLLIACVNAANLMLARGSQRQREIAICLAIGAGRRRIIGQLLVESALLALLAAAVALPTAWWGLQLAGAPLNIQIPFDRTVLVLTVMLAVATTMAFGLAPALRVSAQQPSTALGPVGARSDALPRQSRARRALVVAQVALSLGLLATAWQLVATVRAQAVSGGVPPDRLLMASVDLQRFGLTAAEHDRFYRTLLDEASRLPGVEAAGLARANAVWNFGRTSGARSIRVWGPDDAPAEGRETIGGYAGGNLFGALGLRTIQGRAFTEADAYGRPKIAVVNLAFAGQLNRSGVGSIIRVAPRGGDFGSSLDVAIVGIVEAAVEPREMEDGQAGPRLYLPSPIEPEPALAIYLSSATNAAALSQPVRELVSRIDPRVPILEIGTVDELNAQALGPQLWLARAAAFLGVVGLLLATAGLYGVASFVVAMRSREIAIRMAIGARPEAILSMVLGQSMRMAAIGLVIGGAAAVVASRIIQSEYHGIQGIDPVAFGGSAGLFVAAMLLASAIPAVRASRVDPVEKLKET